MKAGLAKIWVAVIIVAVLGLGLTLYLVKVGNVRSTTPAKNVEEVSQQESANNSSLTEAQKRFQTQWQRDCEGTGPITLTASPMKDSDYAFIIPLGLLAGAHVTPIDHLYFSPKNFQSARNTYPVFAMGDGYIIDISRRSQSVDTGASRAEEFRLTFQHTCTFYTYFDLVTGLTDDVYAAFPDLKTKDFVSGHMKVKAGQQIGMIGGQTLDTAVYNLERKLTGFIHPELYDAEGWKIHTDNFFEHFNAELQKTMLARNPRVAEPRSGKIDYDVDGKLIGNWFKEGTKGYIDESASDRSYYWEGHLALVPDLYDPTMFWVSIGNWQGKAAQWVTKGNSPDPAEVDLAAGLIKYELVVARYLDANGKPWNNFSFTPSVKGVPDTQVQGTALFQLLENRKLKAEFFPGKSAAQVSGFTDQAWTYFR